MSVFPGADHTVINGGQFNATVTNHSGDGGAQDTLNILLGHSATAGLLNARERFDAPKCAENTRISIMQGLRRWVEADTSSTSSMLWLYGPAGVGKSALAQSLALLLQLGRNHAASFFFSRTATAVGRSDGNMLVATLAYQLAMNFEPLQPFIAKSIKKNPAIFTFSNAVQMEKLVVEPINRLRKTWRYRYKPIQRLFSQSPPRLVVIDGLDECNDPNIQRDLLVAVGNAVQRLRMPLRFIVASRPESHILSTLELDPVFEGPNGIVVTRINLGEDPNSEEDITVFLLNAFKEIRRSHPLRAYLPPGWPEPSDINKLTFNSSSSFIYAATVIRYIKSPHQRPEECLNRILGLTEIPVHDRPYEPLDDLYRHIFASIPTVNKKSVKWIFDILVFRDSCQQHNLFSRPSVMESLLGFQPGHVEHVLCDLLSIVAVDDHSMPIRMLHASTPDFLLDPRRSGELYIDKSHSHDTIARCYYQLLATCGGDSHAEYSTLNNYFDCFTNHSKQASSSQELLHDLATFDLVRHYCNIVKTLGKIYEPTRVLELIKFSASLGTFSYLIQRKNFKAGEQLLSGRVQTLISCLVERHSVASVLYVRRSDFTQAMPPLLSTFYKTRSNGSNNYEDANHDCTPIEICVAQLLIVIVAISGNYDNLCDAGINLAPKLQHAYLIKFYLIHILRFNVYSFGLEIFFGELISISLGQACYTPWLVSALEEFEIESLPPQILQETGLVSKVIDYISRCKPDIPADQFKRLLDFWMY